MLTKNSFKLVYIMRHVLTKYCTIDVNLSMRKDEYENAYERVRKLLASLSLLSFFTASLAFPAVGDSSTALQPLFSMFFDKESFSELSLEMPTTS